MGRLLGPGSRGFRGGRRRGLFGDATATTGGRDNGEALEFGYCFDVSALGFVGCVGGVVRGIAGEDGRTGLI